MSYNSDELQNNNLKYSVGSDGNPGTDDYDSSSSDDYSGSGSGSGNCLLNSERAECVFNCTMGRKSSFECEDTSSNICTSDFATSPVLARTRKSASSDEKILKNLDFTVTLKRKSDNSITSLNFSAFWGTDDYDETNIVLSDFNKAFWSKRIYDWEGCEYYVQNIEHN